MSKTVQYTADIYDKPGWRAEVFINWGDDGDLESFWTDVYDDEGQRAWSGPCLPEDEIRDPMPGFDR